MTLTRPLSFSLLFLLYLLAYLLVPYWDLPQEDGQKLGMAAFTIGLGLAWAWLASGAMELRFSRREAVWLLVAIGLLGVLNAMPLSADLAWRGDEDHHFKATRMMADFPGQCWLPCLLALVPVIAALLWRRAGDGKTIFRKLLPLQAGVAVLVVLAVAVVKPKMTISPATYPVMEYWAASIFLHLGRPFLDWVPTPEVFYRLVPFLSAAVLAWYGSRFVMKEAAEAAPAARPLVRTLTRGLFILACGSVPVLFYYSSILYLEMPVVLCLTILCLGAEDLLGAPVEELTNKPLWLALLLIGFLKDNVAPILAILVACRWVARAGSVWKATDRRRAALAELRFAFCTMAPYFTYVVYRVFFSGVKRTYTPAAANLADPQTYGILGQAFADQFGLAIILFLVGMALLGLRRRSRPLLLSLALFGGYVLWHVLDLRTVLGYSRFMLYLAPAILCGAVEVFRRPWRPAAAMVPVLLIWIGINLYLSPIYPDGSRKPTWGQYRWDETLEAATDFRKSIPPQEWGQFRMDWTEHSYPYRSALRYITRNYPNDTTLLTGGYYLYWFQFYVPASVRIERGWSPVLSKIDLDESEVAEHMLQGARQEGIRHVLYQARGEALPDPRNTFGFTREKIFRNCAHSLVLFSLPAGAGNNR